MFPPALSIPLSVRAVPEFGVRRINALTPEQKREYFLICSFDFDNKLGVTNVDTVPRDGRKYSEIKKAWREKFGKENCKKLDKLLKESAPDAHKGLMDAYTFRLEHRAWVKREGKKILAEKLPPHVECVKIGLSEWNTGYTKDSVWLDAVAKFRDTTTGEEYTRTYEVTSGFSHKLLIFTPTKR